MTSTNYWAKDLPTPLKVFLWVNGVNLDNFSINWLYRSSRDYHAKKVFEVFA